MLQITCVPLINSLPADIICDSFDLVVVQWNRKTQTLRRVASKKRSPSLALPYRALPCLTLLRSTLARPYQLALHWIWSESSLPTEGDKVRALLAESREYGQRLPRRRRGR